MIGWTVEPGDRTGTATSALQGWRDAMEAALAEDAAAPATIEVLTVTVAETSARLYLGRDAHGRPDPTSTRAAGDRLLADIEAEHSTGPAGPDQ